METKVKINLDISNIDVDVLLLVDILERLKTISSKDIDEELIEFLKIDKEFLDTFNNPNANSPYKMVPNLKNKIEYLINIYEKGK